MTAFYTGGRLVATEAQDRMPREAENASRLPSTDIQAQPSPVLWAPHRAVIKVLAMDVVPSCWPGEGLHFPSGCRPPATLVPCLVGLSTEQLTAWQPASSEQGLQDPAFKTETGFNLYIFHIYISYMHFRNVVTLCAQSTSA